MVFNFLLLIFSQRILPLIFILNLYNYDTLSITFLLKSTQTVFYIMFIFLIGRWDWFSYHSRYIVILLALISILFTLLQNLFFKNNALDSYILSDILIDVVVTLLFFFFLVKAIMGRKIKEAPVPCEFPLKNGIYYIAHGGSSNLLNHHYASGGQKFALDILKLNKNGFRCQGIYPKNLDKYYIFKEAVHSPIDGKIVNVVDGFEDLIPPERDSVNKAGNHIVILLSKNIYILVAHLLKGSIEVKEGERISRGQFLGRIGNSGNTSEPHLHIHCIKTNNHEYLQDGKGIPMIFGGKFCVRNILIRN